jgi:hypothetical protein
MNLSVKSAQVAYIDALQNLIIGFSLSGLSLLLLLVAGLVWYRYRGNPDSENATLFTALTTFIGGTLLLVSLLFVGNIWNWVGLYHPALFAAHQKIEVQNRPRPLL